jgi:hypothetical protein
MKNLRRIVDYSTFAGSINKSKRSKLVAHIHRERTNKRLPEREVEVMPLCGWYEYADPVKERRKDSGEIKAFIRMKDVVFMVFDKLEDGAEDFSYIIFDDDLVEFIGDSLAAAVIETQQPPQILKKDGTPFAGFRGGRKRKELTDEERARIREMRKAGHNVNTIARELHISNRVISEFVKIDKDNNGTD